MNDTPSEPIRLSEFLDALLSIKALAARHDDSGFCPYTLLEMIEQTAVRALAKAEARNDGGRP